MIPRRFACGQIHLPWPGREEPAVTFLPGIFQCFSELHVIQLAVIQSVIFHFSLSQELEYDVPRGLRRKLGGLMTLD